MRNGINEYREFLRWNRLNNHNRQYSSDVAVNINMHFYYMCICKQENTYKHSRI